MQNRCKLKNLERQEKGLTFAAWIHISLTNKTKRMKKIIFLMAVVLMSTLQANAQKPKIADKELLGTWTLEWMQYDGEKKITCGKAPATPLLNIMEPTGNMPALRLRCQKTEK